jgi:hypothetical protein
MRCQPSRSPFAAACERVDDPQISSNWAGVSAGGIAATNRTAKKVPRTTPTISLHASACLPGMTATGTAKTHALVVGRPRGEERHRQFHRLRNLVPRRHACGPPSVRHPPISKHGTPSAASGNCTCCRSGQRTARVSPDLLRRIEANAGPLRDASPKRPFGECHRSGPACSERVATVGWVAAIGSGQVCGAMRACL